MSGLPTCSHCKKSCKRKYIYNCTRCEGTVDYCSKLCRNKDYNAHYEVCEGSVDEREWAAAQKQAEEQRALQREHMVRIASGNGQQMVMLDPSSLLEKK